MQKRLSVMTNNGRFRAPKALAGARVRVIEQAFNFKRFLDAALQQKHKMLWFALSAYVTGHTHVL